MVHTRAQLFSLLVQTRGSKCEKFLTGSLFLGKLNYMAMFSFFILKLNFIQTAQSLRCLTQKTDGQNSYYAKYVGVFVK